jgi:hypothetical protein
MTCYGWWETHKQGVFGDRVHCHRGEFNSSHATDPVALAERSPSNAAELCSKTLCWQSGPGGTNSRWTMLQVSKNTMSMVFVELRLILAFFGRRWCTLPLGRRYLRVVPVARFAPFCPWCNRRLPYTRDHTNTNITTPDVNTAMALWTLPYQDWRSLQLRAQPCAAICWRATELFRKLFDTHLYVVMSFILF